MRRAAAEQPAGSVPPAERCLLQRWPTRRRVSVKKRARGTKEQLRAHHSRAGHVRSVLPLQRNPALVRALRVPRQAAKQLTHRALSYKPRTQAVAQPPQRFPPKQRWLAQPRRRIEPGARVRRHHSGCERAKQRRVQHVRRGVRVRADARERAENAVAKYLFQCRQQLAAQLAARGPGGRAVSTYEKGGWG